MRENAKISQARNLRKAMTKPEIWLWALLKSQHKTGPVFRRQYALGAYILDFYCVKARLAIEVDGARHTEDAQIAYDAVRDDWLKRQGVHVYRLSAAELLAQPDETATGIINLATQRMAELGFPLPSFASQMPPWLVKRFTRSFD